MSEATASRPSGSINRTLVLAIPLVLAVGMGFAVHLTSVKLHTKYDFAGNYKADCSVNATTDCAAVQASDDSTVLGIPVAVWAIPFYLVLLGLAWLALQDGEERQKKALDLLMLLALLSLFYGGYLVWVQVAKIGKKCPYCLGMDAVQLAAFVLALLATKDGFIARLKRGVSTAFEGGEPVGLAASVFALSLGGSLVWYHHEDKETHAHSAQQHVATCYELIGKGDFEKAKAQVFQLGQEPGAYQAEAKACERKAIDAAFALPPPDLAPAAAPAPSLAPPQAPTATAVAAPSQVAGAAAAKPAAAPVAPAAAPSQAKIGGTKTDMGYSYFEAPIGDDDFVKGPANAPITFVEFADFECEYCKMLAQNVKIVREKYKDQARFVFKFYPMDASCNRYMGGEKKHPNACACAKAAYCAGKQGTFWEAHDKLFDMQGNLTEDKLGGYMKEIGVDVAAWETCVKSDAPLKRIQNDIDVAVRAGINGTPRTYINSRLMSGSSTVSIIEYYFKKVLENPTPAAQAGPDAGKPQPVPATADMSPMVETKTAKGTFFIDRFEASIDKQGKAVSLPNVEAQPASWFEAKAACEKAGKRLCTEEEWISACTGLPAVDNNNNQWFNDDDVEGNMYSYGPFYVRGACNDEQETLTGKPVKTGSRATCRTQSGIYDLTGNIGEWIEGEQSKASLTGGNFGSGEGAACNRRGTMFGPGIRNNTTGFRCCADSQVANATTDSGALEAVPGDLVGQQVPKFEINTADGKTVSPATWKGKVSYITFFASWCGSCKRELPELKKWQTELGPKGFQVVSIGVDRAEQFSKDFVKPFDLNYTVAFDPDAKAMGPFDIAAMPTSFVVDKNGVIKKRIVGFKPEDVTPTRKLIEELL